MPAIDPKISEFIQDHHVLTLATVDANQPYCSTMFYVSHFYQQEGKDALCFYFTSDEGTRHVQEARDNNLVAGAIALETSIVGKIRGIQFTGTIHFLEGEEYKSVHKKYIKRFPVAALAKLNLWKIEVSFIKLTDNRLGFGKKIIWNYS